MNDCTDDCDLAAICSQRHWSIYWIIILCSVIFVFGRIMTLGVGDEANKSPFMGANDRSRWATIRSLGDNNAFEIDDVISDRSHRIYRDTIDKVQHVGKDGQLHFYSSKPTLLPTILSYVYRSVKWLTSSNLQDDSLYVVRIMLLIVHGLPWAIYLWLLGSILEKIQVRDWTRYFIVAAAGFATFLSTFAITLNNHLPAAICVMATLYCLIKIVNGQDKSWFTFAMAGLTAAFAAANELPALSFLAIAGLICLIKSPTKFFTGYVVAAALIVAGFFWTNYAAHNDWRPPYAHRGDGQLLATMSGEFRRELDNESLPSELKTVLQENGLGMVREVNSAHWPLREKDQVSRWVVSDFDGKKFTVVSIGKSKSWQVHGWDNWYDFEGSYWTSQVSQEFRRAEIDEGQENQVVYLFHVLFGHHGIFSLTPIWLFSLAGMVALLFAPHLKLKWLSTITIVISIVVIGFYVLGVNELDRNYGGQTSAFRWAFWLAPMWLVCMAPVVDWLGRRTSGRTICLILLGISAASALYSSENPWVHPWLYQIWDGTGLPK